MDKKHLQHTILETTYNRDVWLDVLKEFFGVRKIHQLPHQISVDKNKAEYAVELGSFVTADEREVGVFEVKLSPQVWIERNRVGLRSLLRQVYKYNVDGALIVFVQDHKWRFSYVSEIRAEEGKKETEPKRYTYLFGKNESCRTAADRFEKLKGKPIYLNDLNEAFSVEKLNKDFFKAYKEFNEKFWKYLAEDKKYYKLLHDKRQTDEEKKQKPIRDFAKKLMGRIVFLHFLQKKGWLGVPQSSGAWKNGDVKFLQNLFANHKQKENFHSTALRTLFFKTLNTKRTNDIAPSSLGKEIKIPYLNGGLFDKDISFGNDFDFPEDMFAKLLDFFEQYNFTIDENDPYDSEVGIDPEMLGHIFENLLEENREKGAFYTPKEIVHYMCQESLIEYLHTQLPDYTKEDFEILVRNNQVAKPFSHYKTANEINDKLKAVKICDPAIGSGAFPMGLLKEIFECRRLLYGYLKSNEKFDPAIVKKEIIQQNIYGVDIENGAVEIARLRFWLALVVDETEPQPLPNLDYKIMQGNSLLERFEEVELSHVASDNLKVVEPQKDLFGNIKESQLKITYTKTAIVAEIQKLMKKFFNLEDAELKEKYRNEINELVHEHIEFNFDLRKSQIQRWVSEFESSNLHTDKQKKKLVEHKKQLADLKVSYEKLKELDTRNDKPFFLWKLFFADVFVEGGFDIMIGNPPYIQLQKMIADADVLENASYETFTRTGDIYCLFYEQGNKLLKPDGTLCYISSNTWMRTKFGEALRNYLAEQTNPVKLLNFEDTKIFQTATVEVNIILTKNGRFKKGLKAVAVKTDYTIGTSISDYFNHNFIKLDELPVDGWVILNKKDYEIKISMEENGTQLKHWDIQINFGFKTGFNEPFFIDAQKKAELIKQDKKSEEIIKPLLRGRDIKKYSYKFNNEYVIWTHNGIKGNSRNEKETIPRIDAEKDYKAIYKHLLQYKDKHSPLAVKNPDGTFKSLVDRVDQGDHWTNLRDCAFADLFEKPKLIWLGITDKPTFAYDEKHYITNPANFLSGTNFLKYLLVLLNSKAIEWYLDKITSSTGMGTNQWKKMYVELLPIPEIKNERALQKFEVIADYLIYLNDESKSPANPHTSNAGIASVFEDVLNMMVYELYFGQHMKEEEIDVLKYVDFENIDKVKSDKAKAEIINAAYKELQEQKNSIRNRIILSNIRSKNIIARINSTTH
jgi:TaqI-like C-terminal specificity domain/Eco57I restriction-modification methylase